MIKLQHKKSIQKSHSEQNQFSSLKIMLRSIPDRMLGRAAMVILLYWAICPILVLCSGLLVRDTDPFMIFLTRNTVWFMFLEQCGWLSWIILFVLFLKNADHIFQPRYIQEHFNQKNLFIFFMIALFIWSGLSCLFSNDRTLSFRGDFYRNDGFYSYILYAGLLGISLLICSQKQLRIILKIMIVSASILAIFTILNWSWLHSAFSIESKSSIFHNSNHYGYYLCLMTMSSLSIFLTSRKKVISRILKLTLFALLTAALLRNGSLGPYLAVAFGILVCWIIAFTKRLDKHLLLFASISFITVSLIMNRYDQNLIFDLIRLGKDTKTVIMQPDQAGYAGSGRWQLWVHGVHFAFQNPIFGLGPDNLGSAYQLVGIDIDRPHNELIQIAASLGWPALLFYLSAIAAYIKLFFQLRKKTTWFHASIFAIIIAYFVSSLFGNTMFYTTPFFIVLMGLSYITFSRENQVQLIDK